MADMADMLLAKLETGDTYVRARRVVFPRREPPNVANAAPPAGAFHR